MVKVNIIMNTSMGEVLAFKCCSLPDQNLEVQIENNLDHPVEICNFFVLRNDRESLKVNYVYPPWHQRVVPRDICAFYCSMDEQVWKKYQSLEVVDADGNVYQKAYESSE